MVHKKNMFFFVKFEGVEFHVIFGGGEGKGEGVEPRAEDGVDVGTEHKFLEVVHGFGEKGVSCWWGEERR